ncbi:MAG: YhcH/YjgK/YiaL family protein [Spirochaetaceae bacterium]|nr:YhcH/YjgK/YiaL family protein [Spirochaetaceae bacterium]
MIAARLELVAAHPAAPEGVREAARLLIAALAAEAAGGAALPEGKSKLGPFDLIVSSPPFGAAGELPFESHRRFIDLQCCVSGSEGFEAARIEDCEVTRPYDEGEDAALYASRASRAHAFVASPGDALVFYPEDAHKPRVAPPSPCGLRKAVVKIPVAAGAPVDKG